MTTSQEKEMTKEEYNAIISDIISNPDTATVKAKELTEAINTDLDTLESLKAANADYDKRVRDLQDTNIKLFLSQTGKPTEKEDAESEMSLSEFAHKMVSSDKEEK